MRKLFNYIAVSCLFCLLALNVSSYAHSVQVGYCVNCDGNLRIYVEHWHIIPDYTTTMNIELTVNGVVTTVNGSPTIFITDTTKGKKNILPECVTPLVTFGTCPPSPFSVPPHCGANTCNYWVAYDFLNVQRGVPISIKIINGGSNPNTEDGCSMFPAITPTFVIPLNAAPTAGPDQTICTGNNASINLANYSGTIQWQSSATSGGPWTNIAGATGAPLSTGILTFTTYYQAIVTGDCGNLTSNQVVITVGQPPISKAGTDISTCPSNTPVNIGTSTTVGYSYSWAPGIGLSSTSISNPTVALTTSGTTTYTVTTSSPGCVSTTDEVVVTVTSLPTATISGTSTVCQGETGVNITFTGANATPPYTFTYKINGGGNQTATSIGNTAMVAVATNTLGTVTYDLVSVQDATGVTCSQAQSGTVAVTIKTGATANIIGTTTVCENDPLPVLTFIGTSGTAPFTFTYSINGGTSQSISTTIGNTVNITAPTDVAGTFNYKIVGIMDASLLTCSSANSTAIITVSPLPVSTITGTTEVCLNGPQPDITFTGLVGSPPFTFNYSVNGGANQTISTASGNTVKLSVPTNAIGTFIYANGNASSAVCNNSGGDTAKITVNPLPTASISGTTSVCRNGLSPDVTFTGSVGSPPFTFSYTINGGPIQKITTDSGNVVSIPASTATVGTYTYALVSVKDGSLSACSNAVGGTAVITVNPSVSATISGTTNICEGTLPLPDISFTGINGTAPYTFNYSINNGTSQSISTTVGNSISLQAPTNVSGVFTYSLVSVQDAGSSTCYVAFGSSTITVNALPTATVAGSTTICQNAAQPDVTFTGANGVAPYTFTYTINNGSNQKISTNTGNAVTVPVPTNVAGTYTYSLVSVEDASAFLCSQPQSGSATIVITSLPTAIVSGTTTVCLNATPPNITFTGTNGIAPYTFSYTMNGGAVQTVSSGGGNSATIPVQTSIAGVFTYSLVSVSDASSTACNNSANGNAIVRVNPLPTGTISGPSSICQNSTGSIVFNGGAGSAPYTFTYTVNGGSAQNITTVTGNSVNMSAPTNIPGPYNYSLVSVRDGSVAACTSNLNGSVTYTVAVNPLPIAKVGPPAAVCIHDPEPNIIFKGFNGTAPYTFTYSINNGVPQTISTINSDSISVAVPTNTVGTYTYSMVSLSDAGSATCINTANNSTIVSVNPVPLADFAVDPIVANTSDPRISVIDQSVGASVWRWDFGDLDSAYEKSPLPHIYADTGNYVIKLIVASQYGCKDTVSHTITIEVPYLFFIPNAFSPNGDGKNEIFYAKGEGVNEFEMLIFDRWGNFIFYSDDIAKGWNGIAAEGNESAQTDVYVYSVKLKDLKGKEHSYRGTVTLVK